MEKEDKKENVTCFFDKEAEDLNTKIIKIFESYLDRKMQKNAWARLDFIKSINYNLYMWLSVT